MKTYVGIPMLGFNEENFKNRVSELKDLNNIKVLIYHNFKESPSEELVNKIKDAYESVPDNFYYLIDQDNISQGVLSVRLGLIHEFLHNPEFNDCSKFITFDDDDQIIMTQAQVDRRVRADMTRYGINLENYQLEEKYVDNTNKVLNNELDIPSYIYATFMTREFLLRTCDDLHRFRYYKLSMCEDMILSNYLTRMTDHYEQINENLVNYVQMIGQTSTFVFNDHLSYDIFNKVSKGVDLLRMLLGKQLTEEQYQYILFSNLSFNYWQIKGVLKKVIKNV